MLLADYSVTVKLRKQMVILLEIFRAERNVLYDFFMHIFQKNLRKTVREKYIYLYMFQKILSI